MKPLLPELCIIVPAYNEEKYIDACLLAIIAETKNTRLRTEIIVVDNASTDATAFVVAKYPEVILVREERKGLTRARQCGIMKATAPLVAYVDADTRMPEGWINKVNMNFVCNPRAVCVSGPYQYYDVTPFVSGLVWCWWNLVSYPLYLLIGYMAVGGNFAIRKEAMLRIGGFDESIEFYGEDSDIARRLHKVGKVKFIPSLIMPTSGRRLTSEGVLSSGYTYCINFFSQVFLKRTVTQTYKDIR